MHSMSTRARLLVVLSMICGSFSVALVAEGATAAPGFRVGVHVSTTTPNVGQAIRVAGKVMPASSGKRVKVQAKAAGTGWVTLARPRLTNGSTYATSVKFPRSGSVAIRVVKPRSGEQARGVSRVHNLKVRTDAAAPVISTATLPNAILGRDYTAAVKIADNRAGVFAIKGSLPAGLELSSSTGVISGKPTKVEKKEFTVGFRDAAGRTAIKVFTLAVDETYLITSLKLPTWTVSHYHSTTLKAKTPGTWSLAVHTLPRGFSWNPATAEISGTARETRTTTFAVTFTAANGRTETRNLSITVIADGTPTIATGSPLPGHTTLAPGYSATLATVGNRNGTWTVVGGALPPGLGLSGGGTISGTPTSIGTFNFTVRFSQTRPHAIGADTKAFSIQIDPNTAPQIGNSSMPNGKVGQGYQVNLGTVGNRQGDWALTAGSLPPGLELDGATIAGAPEAVGTSTFTVTFTALNKMTDTKTFTITVTPAL